MNMDLCYFNAFSIGFFCLCLLECDRAEEKSVRERRGNPTCTQVSEGNGGTLCAEDYSSSSSEQHRDDSCSFCRASLTSLSHLK